MKKLISVILAAFILVTSFAQTTNNCQADCLITSCSISCVSTSTGSGGGASCSCFFGFASCACTQSKRDSAKAVTANDHASENIDKLNELLYSFKTPPATSAAGLTTEMLNNVKAKDYAAYDRNFKAYKKYMNLLTEEQKKAVEELLATMSGSAGARKTNQ